MSESFGNTMFLGYSALSDFEALLIKEGFVEEFDDDFCYDGRDFDGSLFVNDMNDIHIRNKDFLLFSMILFDYFDATYLTTFNFNKLIENGLVKDNAGFINSGSVAKLDINSSLRVFQDITPSMYESNETLKIISDIAETIMKEKKDTVLTALKRTAYREEYLLEKYPSLALDDIDTIIKKISHNFSKSLKYSEFWANNDYNNVKKNLGIVKESIMMGLYESVYNNAVYYDGIISSKVYPAIDSNIEFRSKDVCQIMQIDLSPELYHLPIPHSISEVLNLRKRPEIQSFREVFFNWCTHLRKGDFDSVTLIKKDIELAQKALDKYYRWEKSKTKFFNCLIDIALSYVPYLSNIMGAIAPFSTRSILKSRIENSWVLLLR